MVYWQETKQNVQIFILLEQKEQSREPEMMAQEQTKMALLMVVKIGRVYNYVAIDWANKTHVTILLDPHQIDFGKRFKYDWMMNHILYGNSQIASHTKSIPH